ncbi:microtubule-associated protein 70-5 isoform X1 [Sesamum indicum]|uniref:Microtubule-associated protein 70-5 isoform X1 n=1 Tax=Sesamum indicum TaxID=4182 RepID=A0A6I9UN31_SESIN|nr:microtubule-associated protein 70-5 isoform X1 [Sesamum indicum]XP_011095919.1 microtubule-associated protein 70-5 isoform X1 [Sesamum indicum]
MPGIEELVGEDISLVSHPDPVVLELNRLQNQLKEKERELGKAQSEIRALRATEVLKDKALEELGSEVKRLEGKLRSSENHIEQKNLDIKKLTDEKKEALAAQYAAEATLRRVYANQKDDDSVPIELVIAPLEAELKMHKNEIAALQEDKRALERLTKSKEAALLEAERILRSALERALIVEEVQNQNFELRRQIEICQEENKILDKTNRQKVLEVEKLSQTIKELEEAILAGGAAANTIRDYRRQISELNEEKRTLERELARVKVSANRIATVVANEWKDEKDKVMPVKQWLEERRMLQAEMQKLKDKLAISERAAKAEAQVKEKLKLRLKTLEEGLKHVHSLSVNTNGSPKNEKSNNFFGILSSNTRMKKRSTSQPRPSTITRSSMQMMDEKQISSATEEIKLINNLKKKNSSGESLLKKSLWASRNKVIDNSEKENAEMNKNAMVDDKMGKIKGITGSNEEKKDLELVINDCEDMVSGFLYDRLQKEVISLRKFCDLKDSTLNSKDEEIKMLMKKIETLTRAMEVESKKMKREAAIREKDSALTKVDEKIRSTNSSKRSATFSTISPSASSLSPYFPPSINAS